MKVSVVSESPPRLCLVPETPMDHKVMDRLQKSYLLMGYGRSIEGSHLHMMLPLCRLSAMAEHIAVVEDQFKRMGLSGESS